MGEAWMTNEQTLDDLRRALLEIRPVRADRYTATRSAAAVEQNQYFADAIENEINSPRSLCPLRFKSG